VLVCSRGCPAPLFYLSARDSKPNLCVVLPSRLPQHRLQAPQAAPGRLIIYARVLARCLPAACDRQSRAASLWPPTEFLFWFSRQALLMSLSASSPAKVPCPVGVSAACVCDCVRHRARVAPSPRLLKSSSLFPRERQASSCPTLRSSPTACSSKMEPPVGLWDSGTLF
jgi:hypothetical protein